MKKFIDWLSKQILETYCITCLSCGEHCFGRTNKLNVLYKLRSDMQFRCEKHFIFLNILTVVMTVWKSIIIVLNWYYTNERRLSWIKKLIQNKSPWNKLIFHHQAIIWIILICKFLKSIFWKYPILKTMKKKHLIFDRFYDLKRKYFNK